MNVPFIWSDKAVKTLDRVINHLGKTKLKKSLGYIFKYYINKNKPVENWKVTTASNNTIKKDVLVLVYTLEIFFIKSNLEEKNISSKTLIYKSLHKIISDVISDVFKINTWSLNYDEIYLVNLLAEMISPETNDEIRDIVKSCYFTTRYLMTLNNTIFNFSSLINNCELVDLDLIPTENRREILNILKTKRTLYLRILLVLSFQAVRNKIIISNKVRKNFKDGKTFKEFLNDDIIQISVVGTGQIIQDKWISKSNTHI